MVHPVDGDNLEVLEEVEEIDELPRVKDESPIIVPLVAPEPYEHDAAGVFESIQSLNEIRDLDTLLEQVLLKARRLVRADAGTVYLKAKKRLFFSYVQNDTLFTGATAETRYVYSSRSLPIDRSSLAGYVADTADPLLIDNVYDIRSDVSYSFNPDFDVKAHYKTTSMLIVPMVTRRKEVVGVLQLINATADDGKAVPYSGRDRLVGLQFAQSAADAIERARLYREMVLRMVELSTLRDPYETAQHAKRVGSYSVELYDKWASAERIDRSEIKANREVLRTAAILHDVGKVAISDTILKKGTDLTDDESRRMRLHTIYGARMFRRLESPWDRMAQEVALNHHERWDGKGYPGRIDNLFAKRVKVLGPKRGEEIPIWARIVGLTDVYDALISRRAYKKAWDHKDVVQYVRRQSAKQFDPRLVELFLDMPDVIASIRKKYP
ncbi:MAG: HD domain-containing phosphohydrolase [Spirochaetia bacterium]